MGEEEEEEGRWVRRVGSVPRECVVFHQKSQLGTFFLNKCLFLWRIQVKR